MGYLIQNFGETILLTQWSLRIKKLTIAKNVHLINYFASLALKYRTSLSVLDLMINARFRLVSKAVKAPHSILKLRIQYYQNNFAVSDKFTRSLNARILQDLYSVSRVCVMPESGALVENLYFINLKFSRLNVATNFYKNVFFFFLRYSLVFWHGKNLHFRHRNTMLFLTPDSNFFIFYNNVFFEIYLR